MVLAADWRWQKKVYLQNENLPKSALVEISSVIYAKKFGIFWR